MAQSKRLVQRRSPVASGCGLRDGIFAWPLLVSNLLASQRLERNKQIACFLPLRCGLIPICVSVLQRLMTGPNPDKDIGHISLSAPLDSEAAAEWIELTALHLPEGIATSLLVSLF